MLGIMPIRPPISADLANLTSQIIKIITVKLITMMHEMRHCLNAIIRPGLVSSLRNKSFTKAPESYSFKHHFLQNIFFEVKKFAQVYLNAFLMQQNRAIQVL